MNFKEVIENLLEQLKTIGFDRRSIERELGYKENYIDQLLSKGGNKKFITLLNRFLIEKSNIISSKDEKIAAQDAAIRVIFLELANLKHLVTGESVSKVHLDLEEAIRQALKR